MKIESLIMGALIFVVVITSAIGFYGTLELGYRDAGYGTVSKINNTYLTNSHIVEKAQGVEQNGSENLFVDSIKQIPYLGTIVVTVFGAEQVVSGFINTLRNVGVIGMELISLSMSMLNIAIPESILNIIKVGMGLAVLFAIVAAYLRWRV